MMYNKVASLIKHTNHSYCVLLVKYVTESRRNISVHLFQSRRPGMGEELQDRRINKLIAERKLIKTREQAIMKSSIRKISVPERIRAHDFLLPVGDSNH